MCAWESERRRVEERRQQRNARTKERSKERRHASNNHESLCFPVFSFPIELDDKKAQREEGRCVRPKIKTRLETKQLLMWIDLTGD